MNDTADYTLLVVDVSGIQDYVFNSNKLTHIIGASQLVHEATHGWVYEALERARLQHNLDQSGEAIENRRGIEKWKNGRLDAEVVYVGGGNAVILFADPDKASLFAQRLSSKALIEAPGLSLIIKKGPLTWTDDQQVTLRPKLQEILGQGLREKKDHRKPTVGLLGLGVTADCQFTGLPAVGFETDQDRNNQRVSAEIRAKGKDDVQNAANNRLTAACAFDSYAPVTNFDDFGTRGESSYIAVVHADGNGIGKRFEKVGEGLPNRAYIKAVRALSQRVNQAGMTALRDAVAALKHAWRAIADPRSERVCWYIDEKVLLRQSRDGKDLLPIRPILFGGDDTTFVCDGRLGLSLTRLYLSSYSRQALSDDSGDLASARAGIAVVKSHYPVARAYQMAEALAGEAKKRTKEHAFGQAPNPCVMDWHFGVNGVVADLDALRNRDYKTRDGHELMMRPLTVQDDALGHRDWDTFARLVETFSDGDDWRDKRNKVKALRTAIRNGSNAVKAYTALNNVKLPEVRGTNADENGGLIGTRSAYFDAIEALDFYARVDDGHEG